MSPADAIRAVSAFPELLRLPLEAIKELADWLDGDDDHPEPVNALDALKPLGILKSELALARAEARAKAARG